MRVQIWITRDGRRIPITRLGDVHLYNCIKMIRRGYDAQGRRVSEEAKRLLPALVLEAELRAMGVRLG